MSEAGFKKGSPGIQPPNPLIAQINAARMKETDFWLSTSDREIVRDTIAEHCEVREWTLHAVQAPSNHVHVVVTAKGHRPETVRDQFKAWCTRRLKEVQRTRGEFWTEGGGRRWINNEDDLEAAIAYVLEAQDRKERDHR